MIRVKLRHSGRLEHHGGGTIRCDVSGAGDLLVSRLQKVSRLTAGGIQEGLEMTPIKIYAAGTWQEAEYVEEPGDGLVLEEPAASAPAPPSGGQPL